MYVLYEESGSFKAEKILSKAETSLQVESPSGKRSKIRANSVIFEFDAPEPVALLDEAQTLADQFDIDFLWECAPQEDIQIEAFAQEYFGHEPTPQEKAGLLVALHNAPAYFHRRGRGRYRPAPPDILKAALAAIERRRQEEEQKQDWKRAMIDGQVPADIASVLPDFLYRPDKNLLAWKAFNEAASELRMSTEALLLHLKVWPHALALHQARFLREYFPKGTHFEAYSRPAPKETLPLAEVTAYSLDDTETAEVDDALSVSLNGQIAIVGIHIAAPALTIERDSALDNIARERMSTVYTPGNKIPMLPEDIVANAALIAGQERPAVSLYVHCDLDSGDIQHTETRLETIRVQENLHHGSFNDMLSAAALAPDGPVLPYNDWIRPLWQVSRHLSKQRELLRGSPEDLSRTEYSVVLNGPADNPDTPVSLRPRRRDHPLDLMVAEFMILANNLWGGLLHDVGLPGIYRSQQTGRVRLTTYPLPHERIGVPQYAWSTSPLRRYVDLINQMQVVAAAKHGVRARLVAPLKPRHTDFFAFSHSFETQYAAWNHHQQRMIRYWCLRWIQQQNITQAKATVIRDDLVRWQDAPLISRVEQLPTLQRGDAVMIDVIDVDELNLEAKCRWRETLPCEH